MVGREALLLTTKGGNLSDNAETQRVINLLQEITMNQKLQLERQAESLALQKEQFRLVQEQTAKAERLQERAEALQAKSAQIMEKGRRVMAVALPAIAILLLYAGWLILRR